MKNMTKKVCFFCNHVAAVCFLFRLFSNQAELPVQRAVPLLLAVIFLSDIAYIVSCNLRENQILYGFCGLLAADSWYLLAAACAGGELLFRMLSPVVITLSIRFCFLFLFQGYKYGWKKQVELLLWMLCAGTVLSAFWTDRVYAGMFGIQFAVSVLSFFFLLICHWKRVSAVLRKEKRVIGGSIIGTLLVFGIYCGLTGNVEDHLGNFGMYLVVCMFSLSVHGIALKESRGVPLSSILSGKQQLLCGSFGTLFLYLAVASLGLNLGAFFVLLNLLPLLYFLLNLLLEQNLKKEGSRLSGNSPYDLALQQLQNEEKWKGAFAVFLHDEVLQDLLSVKNLTSKSNRPDVQKLIYETLDKLNTRIRNQMQDYHPILLKSLTLKENLEYLITGVSEAFPDRTIAVSFTCPEQLFLEDPYDLLVYRWIRELLTNVFKHSDGTHAWITLSEEKGTLRLAVCDNGSQGLSEEKAETARKAGHKGLSSVMEQAGHLGGRISFSHKHGQGACMEIELMMNRGDSYQYFTRG